MAAMPLRFSHSSFEWRMGANTVSTIPIMCFAASTEVPQITIEEPSDRQHYLSALLVTSVERAGPMADTAAKQRE
jgi:hypothetical protein